MAGRPSAFSQETATAICDRLAAGESLRTICADEALPAESTIYLWLQANSEFSEQYARARKSWADAQLEEIRAIAKDDTRSADHKRLEIDTLKWAMGKLNGKYSDKLKHVGGDEGDAPIRTVTGIEWTVVAPEA